MARDMLVTERSGVVGLAASLDADTDGHEGLTYVWTAAEIDAVLGPDAPLFSAAYGVTPDGNWEGRTILSRVRDDDELARTWSMSRDEVAQRLADARGGCWSSVIRGHSRLVTTRCSASWNGLAMAAFAEAGRVLPDGTAYTAAGHGDRVSLRDRSRDCGWSAAAIMEGRHDPARRPCSRTIRTSRRAFWRSTRPPSTSAGSAGHRSSWISSIAHFADPEGGFHDTADDADGPVRASTQPRRQPSAVGQLDGCDRAAPTGRPDRTGQLP